MLSLGLTAIGGFVAYGEGTTAVYYHAGDIEITNPSGVGALQLVDNEMTRFAPSEMPDSVFNSQNLGFYFKWWMLRRESAPTKTIFLLGGATSKPFSFVLIPSSVGNVYLAQYNNGRNAGQDTMRYNVLDRWCYAKKICGSNTISLYTDEQSSESTNASYQGTAVEVFYDFSMRALAEVDYRFAIAWTRALSATFTRHIMPLCDVNASYGALICPESQTVKEL